MNFTEIILNLYIYTTKFKNKLRIVLKLTLIRSETSISIFKKNILFPIILVRYIYSTHIYESDQPTIRLATNYIDNKLYLKVLHNLKFTVLSSYILV